MINQFITLFNKPWRCVIKNYKVNFKLIKSLKYFISFLLNIMSLCFGFIKSNIQRTIRIICQLENRIFLNVI